jgi:putative redox protein
VPRFFFLKKNTCLHAPTGLAYLKNYTTHDSHPAHSKAGYLQIEHNMKTITRWKQDMDFDSTYEQHTIALSGGTDALGQRLAFSPKALLLSGLAGCSGIDVVDILKKMKVDFSGLEVSAEADQTEEHPKVFKDIYITYTVATEAANRDKVQRAVELSLTKYCGVSAMLGKHASIVPQIDIVPPAT